MIRIFVGYDGRESIGWHVFMQSLVERASAPFSITPLYGRQRDGTNAFTYARFLVPSLCDYKGWAIFLDGSDMMLRDDIASLWTRGDPTKAVQVVQHNYRTKHARKYIGTQMEADNGDYPRKNWSSVILWNCEHPANALVRPHLVESVEGSFLHRFSWLQDSEIGALPPEWNHLVRESEPNQKASLAHYTLGLPSFLHYEADEFADEWRCYARKMYSGGQYEIPQIPMREAA